MRFGILSCVVSSVVAVAASGGCVLVNPGDVHVGSPAPVEVGRPKPTPEPMRPYGPELERVIQQQDKVFKEIRKGHYSHVADEAGKWMEMVRRLNGYAGTSHDAGRFQMYCEQLLTHVQAVRDAAVREESIRCEQAWRACDPILNNFTRDFPISAMAPPARTGRPSSSPPPRVP
jgi:hypothetical protein